MARILAVLGAFAGRRRRFVVLAWLALAAAAAPFAAQVGDHLSSGGFEVPGSESLRHIHYVDRVAGGAQPFTFLVRADDPGAAARRLETVLAQVRRSHPELRLAGRGCAGGPGVPRRVGRARACASPDGRLLTLTAYAAVDQDAALRIAGELKGLVQQVGARPTRTYVLGSGAVYDTFEDVTTRDIAEAEALGLPVVLVVLVALFGALVAALLPLALGVVAVVVTLAVMAVVAAHTEVSIYAQSMASMIGLGVAVDYSLFILARFREELAAGASTEAAVERAMRTSGTAVVFSGLTVIASLGTVWLVPVRAVQSMAAAAMLVVAVAVLAAATLLPALLHLLGRRVDAVPVRLPGRRRATEGAWARFATLVMRHPLAWFTGAAVLLVALALPAVQLRTLNTSIDQLPAGEPTIVGTHVLERLIGPGQGREGALFVNATPTGRGTAAVRPGLERLLETVRRQPEVARAAIEPLGRGLQVVALLRVDPESSGPVERLVPAVRAAVARSGLRRVADVQVGGVSAFQRDLTEQVGGDLGRVIVGILVLAYAILLLLLRSLLLPLKAVIVNLLSIGAAYGVLVAVFQWGWLDWTGFHHLGHVGTLTPPLVLAITFGLSMDYEVFLLLRIKERYDAHGDNARAVAEGLAGSARVITSAALIMVVVFGAFVLTGVPAIKEIGLGLAVAIAIDATVTRLVLVPATMRLLGDWNWWLPAWLDRRLPHLVDERHAAASSG